MTVFWLALALLLVGSVLYLLPALLGQGTAAVGATASNLAVHRDQWIEAEADLAAGLLSPEQHAQAREDIQRRVLEDALGPAAEAPQPPARRTALALGLLLPMASVLTYLALGDPESAATAPAPEALQAEAGRHAMSASQIQRMVTGLAERLRTEPGNADGWLMLARSYTALGRYADAATALRRATDLLPPNAGLLADLADLTGMAQGKRLAGEPTRLVQRALKLDPQHVKALALAGSAAFEQRDYAAARGHWTTLLGVLPADAPMRRSIQGSLSEVDRLEGARPVAAGSTRALTGRVEISPALAARVAPGDTLFVYARPAQGSRMPLALLRRSATSLPFEFQLGDAQAVSPDHRLSSQAQVVVGARISRSGQATPQSGDLQALSGVVARDAQGLVLTINQVEP